MQTTYHVVLSSRFGGQLNICNSDDQRELRNMRMTCAPYLDVCRFLFATKHRHFFLLIPFLSSHLLMSTTNLNTAQLCVNVP